MPAKNHGPRKTLENFIAGHHTKMMNCTKSSAFHTEFRSLSIPTLSEKNGLDATNEYCRPARQGHSMNIIKTARPAVASGR